MSAASTGAGNAGAVTIQGLNSPANSFVVEVAVSLQQHRLQGRAVI